MPSLGSSTYTGSVDTGDTYLQVNVTKSCSMACRQPNKKYGFYLDTTSAKGNYFLFLFKKNPVVQSQDLLLIILYQIQMIRQTGEVQLQWQRL